MTAGKRHRSGAMASRELRVATTARGMTAPEHFDLVVTATSAETPQIRAIRLARPHGEPLPELGRRRPCEGAAAGRRRALTTRWSTARPIPRRRRARTPICSGFGSRSRAGAARASCTRCKAGDVGPGLGAVEQFSARAFVQARRAGRGRDRRHAGALDGGPADGERRSLSHASMPAAPSDQLAFRHEVEALAPGPADVPHRRPFRAVRRERLDGVACGTTSRSICCGPTPMIDAAIANAKRLGWAEGPPAFRDFRRRQLPRPATSRSRWCWNSPARAIHVPADKTILDVLIEAGDDPLHDCKRGDCGICQVGVIEGVPDHRDYILSDAERAAGKLMQICISRSKTPRLVLDL